MERDKLLGTMDAKVWTDEFMATKARLGDEEFDHAMMLAWFANAIMAGFDEANRRAQRALDAERERVKELEEWQRVVVGTGTDQEAVVRMAATEYTKTAVQCWKAENAKLTAQLATLQQLLEDVLHTFGYLRFHRVAGMDGLLYETHNKMSPERTVEACEKRIRAALAAQDAGKEVGNGNS